ncbi:MAG: hypothetical protein AB7I59_07215 [Geminicoccaceae bacterium]
MSAELSEPKKPLAEVIQENWSSQLGLGGSRSGFVACYAANQTLNAIWRGGKEERETKEIRDRATLRRVADIGARDVIEAMLAAQMVATHEAVMECFRRAALSENSFAAREMGLRHSEKLARSFVALTDALNRRRGKGQQVVRVEHVTIEAGGRAIVGAVSQGGSASDEREDQAHAQAALVHARESSLRCAKPSEKLVPVSDRLATEALRNARRDGRQRRTDR